MHVQHGTGSSWSTVGSSEVETCIERRIMQMTVPAPKKGGIVQVSYPSLFSPG